MLKQDLSANTIKIDRLLAIIGMAISVTACVIFILLNVMQPLFLMAAIFLTCLFYFIKRDSLLVLNLEDRGGPPFFLRQIPNIHIWITVISCLYGLFIIHYSDTIISRPLWLLVGLSFPALIILLEIILKIYKFRGGELSLFIQLLVLLITISVSSIYTFPYIGGDTWVHISNAEKIAQAQPFTSLQASYENYPLFPVLIDLTSMITGAGFTQASRMLVIFPAIACAVLMYCLARDCYGPNWRSLIILLLLIGSKWIIYWNTLVVSMSLALFLFTAFYVLLSSRLLQNNILKSILLYAVAIISPFFHPLGSVAVVILCSVYWLTDSAFFSKNKKIAGGKLITLVIFVIVVTLTQWMYYGQTFALAMKNLMVAIFQDTPNSVNLAVSKNDPFSYNLDNLNFFFLLCLALVEILRQIRLRRDWLSLFSGLSGLVFVAFAYFTEIINLQAVLPFRWLLFGTLLLIIPASNIIISFIRQRQPVQKILFIVIFTTVFFLGYSNRDVNVDHPFYGVYNLSRSEITFPEYAGLKFIQNHQETLQTDLRVSRWFWSYLQSNINNPRMVEWDKIDLSSKDLIFSLRTVNFNHSLFVGDSGNLINLGMPYLNQIYDSGDVKWMDWMPSLGKNR